jgi:hypothetical protein
VPQLAECFRSEIEPRRLAVMLAAMWIGLLKIYLSDCPKIDLVSAVSDGFDCIMNGALKKEAGI